MVTRRRSALSITKGKRKKTSSARVVLLNKWWRSVLGDLRGSAIRGVFPAAWRSIRLE